MLSQVVCQPTSPYGLNLRFGYSCILIFFICGYSELRNVEFENFVLVQLFVTKVLSRGFKKLTHQCD
jgi:hypothetical protein